MPVALGVKSFFNQVRNDFSISLGGKFVPFFNQLLLKLEIVFHDAVVYHHDLACAIAMRVRVLFRGPAVRGPARVANAPAAFQRLQPDRFFQVAQLAFSPSHLHRTAVAIAADSDPGRVIPAIFQAPEPLNNDGYNPFFAYITYDSTHNLKKSCLTSMHANRQSSALDSDLYAGDSD